jgi:hypothetical protein
VSLREVQDTQYYFCPEVDCPVVYYAGDGRHVFRLLEIRERVYQKEPNSDSVLVCYCFRHTLGDIREEAGKTDASPIVESIKAGIQASQCACDWRNPQGDCCLGNVRALLRRYHSA